MGIHPPHFGSFKKNEKTSRHFMLAPTPLSSTSASPASLSNTLLAK